MARKEANGRLARLLKSPTAALGGHPARGWLYLRFTLSYRDVDPDKMKASR
jgi:hypothetical protein